MKVYIYIFCLVFFLISNVFGKTNYFEEGKVLFDQKKYLKSKFKFEKDIVFNPKSELSYLFLAKIFNEEKKYDLEEQNLNTVILLDPKNEEAVFSLAKLKLEKSDYIESKKMIENLLKFCKNYCQKSSELKTQIDKSLKK